MSANAGNRTEAPSVVRDKGRRTSFGRSFFRIFVGFGLLCFLLCRIGFGHVVSNLASMDYRYVPLVLIAFCLSHFMNGMTLKLSSRMIRMGWGQAFLISMRSWSWGQFTPGRIGEISLISYLHDLGMPWGAATSLAFVNRAIVLLLLVGMALSGMVLFGFEDVAIRWAVLSLVGGCLGGGLAPVSYTHLRAHET